MAYISVGKSITIESLIKNLKELELLKKPINITFNETEFSLRIEWDENKLDNVELPYLFTTKLQTERHYNPNYGDDRECVCGHPYHRHFDGYEDNKACGCKYCGCFEFKEK